MKYFIFLTLLLNALNSFSFETLDFRAVKLDQSFTLYQDKDSKHIFPYFKDGEKVIFPQGTKILDYTAYIHDKDLDEKALLLGCKNFRMGTELLSETCTSFLDFLIKEFDIDVLAIKDHNPAQHIDGCLPLEKKVKFIVINKRFRFASKGFHRAYDKFPIRCKLSSPQELFLMDYYYMSFEDIVDRDRTIKAAYDQENKASDLVTDFIVRRFVNNKDWFDAMFYRGVSNPYRVYEPSPQTWKSWRDTLFLRVEATIRNNTPLSIQTLSNWKKGSVKDKFISLKELRGVQTSFNVYFSYSGMSKVEIKRLESFNFGVFNHDLGKFHPKKCLDEYEDNIQNLILYANRHDLWEETELKDEKNCGIYHYPKPLYLKAIIDKILIDTNSFLSESHQPEEVFHFALKQQLNLVALHPFNDGNGRVSRWLMDYITGRGGIPTITSYDTMSDITETYEKYSTFSKRGMFHNILILERCLHSSDVQCMPETLHAGALEVTN